MTMAPASFEALAAGALCVWRVTHLFNAEDGPGRVLVRLRRRAGDGWLGQLLDCFYCLSLWVAVPASLLIGSGWKERLLLWLALSGAACLLEHATRERNPYAGLVYEEKQEYADVLRQSETAAFERSVSR
jgi:hypothetical protein